PDAGVRPAGEVPADLGRIRGCAPPRAVAALRRLVGTLFVRWRREDVPAEFLGIAERSGRAHGCPAMMSRAQPIGVLGRPCESLRSALRRTPSGAPNCRAMLARIAESFAQASAWLSAR